MSLVRVLGRPLGVLVGHARWAVRTDALVLLLVALVALPPLAFMSQPDPLWISGAYDDADFDDVVVAVGAAIGHLQSSRTSVGRPGILRAAILTVETSIVQHVLRSTRSVRAPPA